MKILMLGTWHRRCGPYNYARALESLGYDVLRVGPWDESVPFGTHGREPHIQLPKRHPPHYTMDEITNSHEFGANAQFYDMDAFWIVEGGENIRILDMPEAVPVVHISSEGTNLEWSKGRTALRYSEIMANTVNKDGVTSLPKAFDPLCALPPNMYPAYDLVQLASPRAARVHFWQEFPKAAPDMHGVFGDIWGPAYRLIHNNALATWVCQGVNFMTNRVVEAMASGCIVFSDPVPAVCEHFEPGVDFIPYHPVMHESGEGYPDPHWIADQLRRLRRDGHRAMLGSALRKVQQGYSFRDRVLDILDDFAREYRR